MQVMSLDKIIPDHVFIQAVCAEIIMVSLQTAITKAMLAEVIRLAAYVVRMRMKNPRRIINIPLPTAITGEQ